MQSTDTDPPSPYTVCNPAESVPQRECRSRIWSIREAGDALHHHSRPARVDHHRYCRCLFIYTSPLYISWPSRSFSLASCGRRVSCGKPSAAKQFNQYDDERKVRPLQPHWRFSLFDAHVLTSSMLTVWWQRQRAAATRLELR
jgi:hypothetical protein